MMRIDSHIHGDPTSLEGDPAAYIQSCHERGIEAAVYIGDVEQCQVAMGRFGDFIIPVCWYKMDEDGPEVVEESIAAGCKGIKFIRPRAPYGDPRYWPLYAKIEEMGAVAIYHTGYLGFWGREAQPVHMTHMRAAEIDVIARRFPDLKILMAHYSNPWFEEGWKVSLSNANVYADLSGGTAILRSTRFWADLFAPDGVLLEQSIRKLCFGSDVRYFLPGEYPFERYTAFYDRIYEQIGLSDELRDLVNRGNIRKLFGLEGK